MSRYAVAAARNDENRRTIRRSKEIEYGSVSHERKADLSIALPLLFFPLVPGIIFRSAAFFLRVRETETSETRGF